MPVNTARNRNTGSFSPPGLDAPGLLWDNAIVPRGARDAGRCLARGRYFEE